MAHRAKPESRVRRSPAQTLFLVASIVIAVLLVGGVTIWAQWHSGWIGGQRSAKSDLKLEDIPFNGTRAYDYLKQLCEIGPRPNWVREHFEIDRHYIVLSALKALADEGKIPASKAAEAIAKYGIQADKINPLYA